MPPEHDGRGRVVQALFDAIFRLIEGPEVRSHALSLGFPSSVFQCDKANGRRSKFNTSSCNA